MQMEVSGYHHNVACDFLSLRPAIYVAGKGAAVFRDMRYEALEDRQNHDCQQMRARRGRCPCLRGLRWRHWRKLPSRLRRRCTPGEIPGAIVAPDEESVRDPADPWPFYQDISRPTIAAYQPAKQDPKRAAVIIFPGGGYRGVSMLKEGYNVARAFNEMGVTAFVVKYRTPSDKHMKDKRVGPLQDAQQAVATVRRDAAKWQIDPARIGVMGFSAGGHLAATTGTMFKTPVLPQWRSADVRPDFLMLIYPVITFADASAHAGSRQKLLGDAPSRRRHATLLRRACCQ